VLLTSLNNLAMPFIRYDIGDRGKMFVDDCPCSRGLSLLRPIGRTYEYFVHSDGTFTIFRDLQTVFEDLPIEDFQIVQQSNDEIVIKIVKRVGYTNAHTDFILKKISLCFAKIARLRVELVDSLPLIGFGKVPHFVSKIPTKYT
jgi:phenylacetate-CoA ligase